MSDVGPDVDLSYLHNWEEELEKWQDFLQDCQSTNLSLQCLHSNHSKEFIINFILKDEEEEEEEEEGEKGNKEERKKEKERCFNRPSDRYQDYKPKEYKAYCNAVCSRWHHAPKEYGIYSSLLSSLWEKLTKENEKKKKNEEKKKEEERDSVRLSNRYQKYHQENNYEAYCIAWNKLRDPDDPMEEMLKSLSGTKESTSKKNTLKKRVKEFFRKRHH
ncbi:reticulocyte binding protein 2 homolog b-like [Cheilinus undulatus]|uniref:reticulocyte binding protein 2 homolog b-like n=1 Tax=Cheilinus undulatus TaxID=241271 RepID=UPI001BD1F82D|nr:reticulocyte binding protein 2 homolog b-like [Cheilinus undulatus]